MIRLKVTKNEGFTLSLEDTFLQKPQGGQIDPPALRFALSFKLLFVIYVYLFGDDKQWHPI